MRFVLIVVGLALGASVLVPRYAMRIGAATARSVSNERPAPPANPAAATGPRSVAVPRDGRGHFQVDGRVDGRLLSFMVDTGASVVALTARDAARLGIHPSAREFVADVRTANGSVRGAPTRLAMVSIGDVVVYDVNALVLPDYALSDNLLGLSFLARLHRFEYSDGRLVLEQ